MIKGAFILAVGFSLGYAWGTQESEDREKMIKDLKEFLASLPVLQDRDSDKSDDVVDGTATEAPNPEPTSNEGETVDD